MSTPKPGTNVPQIPTLSRRIGVKTEYLTSKRTSTRLAPAPPRKGVLSDYIAVIDDISDAAYSDDGTLQFKDIAVGELFTLQGGDGAVWQRIISTEPKVESLTFYYFRANARLYRPPFPGAFAVEYIHLLDASLVERVTLPESSWELTPAGEKHTTSPENLN